VTLVVDIVGVRTEKSLVDFGSSNDFIALEHVKVIVVIQPTTKVLKFVDGMCQKLCEKLGNTNITI